MHWIESTTLERRSAALACSRLKGRHTFDVIASVLEEIHSKYNITNKVICTVTDNFVKAFKEFSETQTVTTDSAQAVLTQTDDGDLIFTNVSDLLDNQSTEEAEFTLPPHHRCGAHTMNLVAVSDSDEANQDPSYKKIYRSTMAKCSALWNKKQ